jgi:peptide/nickel transport system permease protein
MMKHYIAGRFIEAVISLIAMSFIIFILSRMAGDPLNLLLDAAATNEDRALMAAQLGLDRPILEQYGMFIVSAMQGNLGNSIANHQPVIDLITSRALNTIQLAIAAFAASVSIGVPVGVYSAYYRGTVSDYLFRTLAILGQSVPVFWLGLMLMLLFGNVLKIMPTSGKSGLLSYVLPAITMGWYVAAGLMRLTRTSMLEALQSDYIKLARIKGVSETMVIWKHAFKNAAIPVLTFAAILFVGMLGGAVITETVFAWPGLGRLMIGSIAWRDYPVIQGVVLFLSLLYVVANFVVDMLYGLLNPRIHYGK